MSDTASEQLPLIYVYKFGLDRIAAGAGEFSPADRLSTTSETSGAARAHRGERGTQLQDLSP